MKYYNNLIFPIFSSDPLNTMRSKHYPKYYGIQYNYSGKMRLRINNGPEYVVEGPHVFITHPHAYFEYGHVGGKSRHHAFICFHGERIQSYLDGGLLDLQHEPPLMPIAESDQFLLTMYEVFSLLTHSPGIVPSRAVWLFESLLLQINEVSVNIRKLPVYQKAFLDTLAKNIQKAPASNFDFREEAKKCHVTPAHFRRLFKTEYGLPPCQYLIQQRIHLAATLLLTTSFSVAEIAEKAGISNQFYFSYLFKARYHVSPLVYRRQFTGCIDGKK